MNETDNTQLLTELENNLKKQLELARQGNLAPLEILTEKCRTLVEKTSSNGIIEKPEFKPHRQRIEKLYQDLLLLLSSQKDAVVEQLKSIHKGRQTLSAYRDSI